MLKCILTMGIPGSGKSTWARAEIAKDPANWVRINNDQIREMCNGSVWSGGYEKLITETRNFLINLALKKNKHIIIDNVNSNKKHFENACTIAKSIGDVEVIEKPFYIDVEEAIERDLKREGSARVGEIVVRKFWKELGGKQFAHYIPRNETFEKIKSNRFVTPMIQNESLLKCCVFDMDGSMCDISHRNPYDASTCIYDKPIEHVVGLSKLLFNTGYKIFFFSGREDKHKAMTEEWLNKYFGYEYSLHMRETSNKEDDRLLKERLFNSHIKDKYNCKIWVDDRLRVCEWVYQAGLPLFRVGSPTACF